MAHLLGSKTCIDSLRVDVDDLQNVVHDIIGKTGSIKCHSWKFPDKLATDVDITELLERYQYGKNELDNQVSHIVLFEIIIDRLLLVLHGSWRFLHELQTKLLPNTTDSSSTINQQTSLSIGLVVKKYWNKLLHLFTTLQQNEINQKRSSHITTASILSKSNEKYCQTIETTFSPCSSCIKLQQYFRDYGDSIINLCHIYNLPSSLAHHRCSTSAIPEWLSIDDINHWCDFQSKDFDRLSKHLESLNSTLNKTKNDFDSSENRCKQLNDANQRLQQIINDDKQSKKILQDLHEKKLIEMKKDYDQHELNFNEQIKLLTTEKMNLEQQLKEITDECISKGEQIEKLELSKNELKIVTEDRLKLTDSVKTLEQDRIRLQTELDVFKRELEERHHDLQKERLRIEKMIRQEENSQSKQKTLSKSYEELSQECESLKKQITELEIERDELQKSLQIIQKQHQSSLETIKFETNNHLLQEVASLKSTIEQLHQQKALQTSEVNEPIQSTPTSNTLVHDMQNQMRANELRIDLLRKQNDSLKSSLEKCISTNSYSNPSIVKDERSEVLRNQSRQEQSYRPYSYTNETAAQKPKQTPLWLLNNEILEQQQAFTETKPMTTTDSIPRFNENGHTANGWNNSDPNASHQHDRLWTTASTHIHSTDLLITAESRPPTTAHSSRTLRNGRTLTIPPASVHEMILGKGRTNSSNRPLSITKIRPSTAQHNRRDTSLPKSSRNISSAKVHRCPTCNKSFTDNRNYDIHKLYCRT